jgi:hypothetical protein
MKYALIVVCITLFLFYTIVWAVSEKTKMKVQLLLQVFTSYVLF